MFDIGFWEILIIMVVALLVVGPERLPRLARTVGLWVGKARGFVRSVKADIDRELATEELRRTLAKQAEMPEVQQLVDEFRNDPAKPARPERPRTEPPEHLVKATQDRPAAAPEAPAEPSAQPADSTAKPPHDGTT
jgi:sec-independent protein translocase protein TatB